MTDWEKFLAQLKGLEYYIENQKIKFQNSVNQAKQNVQEKTSDAVDVVTSFARDAAKDIYMLNQYLNPTNNPLMGYYLLQDIEKSKLGLLDWEMIDDYSKAILSDVNSFYFPYYNFSDVLFTDAEAKHQFNKELASFDGTIPEFFTSKSVEEWNEDIQNYTTAIVPEMYGGIPFVGGIAKNIYDSANGSESADFESIILDFFSAIQETSPTDIFKNAPLPVKTISTFSRRTSTSLGLDAIINDSSNNSLIEWKEKSRINQSELIPTNPFSNGRPSNNQLPVPPDYQLETMYQEALNTLGFNVLNPSKNAVSNKFIGPLAPEYTYQNTLPFSNNVNNNMNDIPNTGLPFSIGPNIINDNPSTGIPIPVNSESLLGIQDYEHTENQNINYAPNITVNYTGDNTFGIESLIRQLEEALKREAQSSLSLRR